MPWRIKLHPGHEIVVTTYDGIMPPDELEAAILETLAVLQATGRTRLLGDCRTLTGGHSMIDLYQKAQKHVATLPMAYLREAVLLPDATPVMEKVQFWQTAAGNRGLEVKLFKDPTAAIAWLVENKS